MNADPSTSGRHSSMLLLGYQNSERKNHNWVNILSKIVAPQIALKGKF